MRRNTVTKDAKPTGQEAAVAKEREWAASVFKVYDAGEGMIGLRMQANIDMAIFPEVVQQNAEGVVDILNEEIGIEVMRRAAPFIGQWLRNAALGNFKDERPRDLP